MDVETIRNSLEEFEFEISTEHLQHMVGLKEELNAAPIYDKYPALFSIKNVRDLKRLVDTSTGIDRRKNIYLLGALINGFMSEPIKNLSDKRDTFEAKASVDVDGKAVPFRNMGVLISNTESHAKRKRLFDLSLPIKEKMMGFDKTILEKEWALAKKTGFLDYTSIYSFIKECDFNDLNSTMRMFLVQTEKLYEGLISQAMTSIGVPMDQAEGFDISFWIRNPSFDLFFKKDVLVSSLEETLKGLGFDLLKQSNIRLDVEDRPAKVPRAFCMPLRVPDEIHLVMKPSGGQNDYKSLYHEAGHSEHYANTDPDLPFEFKYLGSHCVSETYAFIFEHIIMTREWLEANTVMSEKIIQDFLQFDMTVKLFFLRRYAAKLVYELKLHSQDLTMLDSQFNHIVGKSYPDMASCYSDLLSKAAKVKIHPVNWASDVDGGFYCADYLRAWILEAQLKSYMKKNFGTDWIKNPKSGEFLTSLWRKGNQPIPIELSNSFGHSVLDIDILTRELFGFFK